MMTALSDTSRTIHEMTMNIPATGVRYLTHSLLTDTSVSDDAPSDTEQVESELPLAC